MKVLFVGVVEEPWQTGHQRFSALVKNGHEVVSLSISHLQKIPRAVSFSRRFLSAEIYDLLLARQSAAIGQAILRSAKEINPEVIWLEWPLLVSASTIRNLRTELPNVKIVSFQDDNPFGTRRFSKHGWLRFFKAIPEYDLHFVKRPSDVDQYKKMGAKRVETILYGYSEDLFYPDSDAASVEPRDVVFIGTALDERVPFLEKLVCELGVEVHIYGNLWEKTEIGLKFPHLLHGPAYADNYRKVLCQAKIGLGFVSHSNLDDYTCRTFEIPACGTLLLAETTAYQKTLLKEGIEAAFFDTPQDCKDKIAYYLSNDSERNKVSQAGCERVKAFSARKMMEGALKSIFFN